MTKLWQDARIGYVDVVIIQWLLLLQETSPYYSSIPEEISDPSKWQEMDDLMHQAKEHIIKVAQQVTREVDIMAEDGLRSRKDVP